MTRLALVLASVLVGSSTLAGAAGLNPQPLPPSPNFAAAMPPGPDARVKITEAYVRAVVRDAYFWAWPIINMHNRRGAMAPIEDFVRAGPAPSAPLNRLAMLTDYIAADERIVACPNQDVVYGVGFMALETSPVVVQVPDFGDRFWIYQIVDGRTDGFATLGKMYGTTPGFYLIVGPDWHGEVPKGIKQVFRSSTQTAFVGPRLFMDDTPEDRAAVQPLLHQIMAYPLAEFDGTMKETDWSKIPVLEQQEKQSEGETQWVFPERFIDQLPEALRLVPPLPGEEARYAQVLAVVEAAKGDPAFRAAAAEAAQEAERELVAPLFEFRNYGISLPDHWTTIANGAAFGTDYFTRTAAAKSNILVNTTLQAQYFYQDLDKAGDRLNGTNGYSITFAKDALPPVEGFWSLTLYNDQHLFAPNELGRYSLGTKNKTLKYNADGSLTIHVQARSPGADHEANWLPAPGNADFSLYLRAYWPKTPIIDGSWTPPAVERRG
ncbi:DUF1254 domain-containing protein [Aureimonas frigidaquae]|uniref:DUF1254 domain-containing protein n=1 Tax=Aureimonas frigidaquae TaxID=424757 RepID=UPI000783111C|nr:DUF1254 domain-containing protein [Aureimonas frigidaquae]